MSKPVVDAFFVGRALSQALYHELEKTLTNALSDLGKFDAEQRERLRLFTQEVMERASRESGFVMNAPTNSGMPSSMGSPIPEPGDLQATIDELRAEIAQVRAQLQLYRSRS
jgi:hypothetical protein